MGRGREGTGGDGGRIVDNWIGVTESGDELMAIGFNGNWGSRSGREKRGIGFRVEREGRI